MVDENGLTHGIMLALIPAWLEHGRMPATIESSSAGRVAVPTQQSSSGEVSTSRKLTRVITVAFAAQFVCRPKLHRGIRPQPEGSLFHCGAACGGALATTAADEICSLR